MGWVMLAGFVIELVGLAAAAYSLAMADEAAPGIDQFGSRGVGATWRAAGQRVPATRQGSPSPRGVARRRARQAARRARELWPERRRWSWIGMSMAAMGLSLQGLATWATWG